MANAAKPGTATTQQLARLHDAAGKAKPAVTPAWLLGLARSERNGRIRNGAELPPLVDLNDLSMFETSSLITEIEDATKKGARVRAVCLRCVRIGFDGSVPCMHDAAGMSSAQRRVETFERERGRW